MINVEINNDRTMQLFQKSYDGEITIITFKNKGGEVDSETTIPPGDMVMLMNYYRYQKENKNPIF